MEKRKSAAFAASGARFVDPKWGKSFPLLWEHLTETAFSDGSARETSTLTIFCEPGLVKLCLSDRAENATGWATGETVEGALKVMEEALRDNRMDWRPSKRAPRRG